MATTFDLEPRGLTPPANGKPPRISFTTRSAKGGSNPIHPATYLQVSYRVGEQEVFADVLTPRDVRCDDADERLYSVCPGGVPRIRVHAWQLQGAAGEGTPLAGEVVLHAWRDTKLLGMWTVGRIEGMGVVV